MFCIKSVYARVEKKCSLHCTRAHYFTEVSVCDAQFLGHSSTSHAPIYDHIKYFLLVPLLSVSESFGFEKHNPQPKLTFCLSVTCNIFNCENDYVAPL